MSVPAPKRYKVFALLKLPATRMLDTDTLFKQFYTESEAALMLGISVSRLHALLDEHIFNDGSERPDNLLLQSSDVVLLRFWNRSTPNPKIIRMPRRSRV